jgi:hypothetical protein
MPSGPPKFSKRIVDKKNHGDLPQVGWQFNSKVRIGTSDQKEQAIAGDECPVDISLTPDRLFVIGEFRAARGNQ